MKKCPFCAEEIQDEAIKCRFCGEFFEGPRAACDPSFGRRPWSCWGYEYRSRAEFCGLPLVHVCRGIDPRTGRPRVAKGIVAVGNIALGVVALGGVAVGLFAFGGLAVGLIAFGGIAAGGIALGGAALAVSLAIGGLAISAGWAIGAAAFAPHAISSLGVDPELARRIEKWFPAAAERFHSARR